MVPDTYKGFAPDSLLVHGLVGQHQATSPSGRHFLERYESVLVGVVSVERLLQDAADFGGPAHAPVFRNSTSIFLFHVARKQGKSKAIKTLFNVDYAAYVFFGLVFCPAFKQCALYYLSSAFIIMSSARLHLWPDDWAGDRLK